MRFDDGTSVGGLCAGLTGSAHLAASRELGVVARPLEGRSPVLTTYLLHREGESSEVLSRFIERVHAIDLPEGARPAQPPESNPPEDTEP